MPLSAANEASIPASTPTGVPKEKNPFPQLSANPVVVGAAGADHQGLRALQRLESRTGIDGIAGHQHHVDAVQEKLFGAASHDRQLGVAVYVPQHHRSPQQAAGLVQRVDPVPSRYQGGLVVVGQETGGGHQSAHHDGVVGKRRPLGCGYGPGGSPGSLLSPDFGDGRGADNRALAEEPAASSSRQRQHNQQCRPSTGQAHHASRPHRLGHILVGHILGIAQRSLRR